jgi:hypothetical protein
MVTAAGIPNVYATSGHAIDLASRLAFKITGTSSKGEPVVHYAESKGKGVLSLYARPTHL